MISNISLNLTTTAWFSRSVRIGDVFFGRWNLFRQDWDCLEPSLRLLLPRAVLKFNSEKAQNDELIAIYMFPPLSPSSLLAA